MLSFHVLLVTQSELAPGVHKFNFSCLLPLQLPTSFESKYGYIRYQIKVEMERPWKFDIKFCFAFTVIKVLDLNYESPALRSPLKSEVNKTFFFGLGSKAMFVSAEIPISGFVSGQAVPITVKVNNESNVNVEEIKASLKKYIHYNSQTPRRRTRERIESAAEVRNSGVSKNSIGNVELKLALPSVPPTNIAFCRIIQVSYEIHVVAKVGGIHRSPLLRLPVTIGTVPLQLHQYTGPVMTSSTNWHMQPSTSSSEPSAPMLHYPPSAPEPPSYPYSQDMRKYLIS